MDKPFKFLIMKRLIAFLFIFGFLISLPLLAQKNLKRIPNTSYFGGESLKYMLHYGFITGGYASLSILKEEYEGEAVFHAVAVGYTTGLTDKIFKVKDIYESYIDKETGLPKKSVRNIKEGGYKYYNEVTFNRENNTVNSQKSGVHTVPEYIHDMVSCFYYLRRMDLASLKKGDVIKFQTYFGDELFPFEVRYFGNENVSTKLGKINCLKFVPIVEPGRIFKSKDDMTIWLTNDQNFIPIVIKFDMIVGSFKCELVEYSNIRVPLKFVN
jgi:hypothetical protein